MHVYVCVFVTIGSKARDTAAAAAGSNAPRNTGRLTECGLLSSTGGSDHTDKHSQTNGLFTRDVTYETPTVAASAGSGNVNSTDAQGKTLLVFVFE